MYTGKVVIYFTTQLILLSNLVSLTSIFSCRIWMQLGQVIRQTTTFTIVSLAQAPTQLQYKNCLGKCQALNNIYVEFGKQKRTVPFISTFDKDFLHHFRHVENENVCKTHKIHWFILCSLIFPFGCGNIYLMNSKLRHFIFISNFHFWWRMLLFWLISLREH